MKQPSGSLRMDSHRRCRGGNSVSGGFNPPLSRLSLRGYYIHPDSQPDFTSLRL